MSDEEFPIDDALAIARNLPAFIREEEAVSFFLKRHADSIHVASRINKNSQRSILAFGGAMTLVIACFIAWFAAFHQPTGAPPPISHHGISKPDMAVYDDSGKAISRRAASERAVHLSATQQKRVMTNETSKRTAATPGLERLAAIAAPLISARNTSPHPIPVVYASCTPERIDGYTVYDLDSVELSRLGITVLPDRFIREALEGDTANTMIWKDLGKGAAEYTFPGVALVLPAHVYADSSVTLERPTIQFGAYRYMNSANNIGPEIRRIGETLWHIRGWKPRSYPKVFVAPGYPEDGTKRLNLPTTGFGSSRWIDMLCGPGSIFSKDTSKPATINGAGNAASPVLVTNSAGRAYAHRASLGSDESIEKDFRIPDFTKQAVEKPLASRTIHLESGAYTLQDLIPIRVRTQTPPSEPDSTDYFIVYWYEPSKELLAAIPERVRRSINEIREARSSILLAPVRESEAIIPNSMEALVYPNPVTESTATVRFKLDEPGRVAISLYDVQGRRVKELTTCEDRDPGSWEKRIDLQDVPAGVYMLAVTTDKGRQAVQKVVVNR